MGVTYRKVQLRVSEYEWKKFKDLKSKGLSAREVLEHSCCPCEKCKGISVIAYNKANGDLIEIPKGILTKRNR